MVKYRLSEEQVVAASLCRGAAWHGDRAPWLHLAFRAEATGHEIFGAAGDDQFLCGGT